MKVIINEARLEPLRMERLWRYRGISRKHLRRWCGRGLRKKDPGLKASIVCLWSNKEIFVTKIEYLPAENSEELVGRAGWKHIMSRTFRVSPGRLALIG